MQSFNVEFSTFENHYPTRINDVTIDAKLLALPDNDSYHLVYHLAGLVRNTITYDCIMADMLDDATHGCCTVEERNDLGMANAAPGTRNFLLYFSPSCSYHTDHVEGTDCSMGECNCEGDIGIITLTPAD